MSTTTTTTTTATTFFTTTASAATTTKLRLTLLLQLLLPPPPILQVLSSSSSFLLSSSSLSLSFAGAEICLRSDEHAPRPLHLLVLCLDEEGPVFAQGQVLWQEEVQGHQVGKYRHDKCVQVTVCPQKVIHGFCQIAQRSGVRLIQLVCKADNSRLWKKQNNCSLVNNWRRVHARLLVFRNWGGTGEKRATETMCVCVREKERERESFWATADGMGFKRLLNCKTCVKRA